MFVEYAVEMGGTQVQGGGKLLHRGDHFDLGRQERFCLTDQLMHSAAGVYTPSTEANISNDKGGAGRRFGVGTTVPECADRNTMPRRTIINK